MIDRVASADGQIEPWCCRPGCLTESGVGFCDVCLVEYRTRNRGVELAFAFLDTMGILALVIEPGDITDRTAVRGGETQFLLEGVRLFS